MAVSLHNIIYINYLPPYSLAAPPLQAQPVNRAIGANTSTKAKTNLFIVGSLKKNFLLYKDRPFC